MIYKIYIYLSRLSIANLSLLLCLVSLISSAQKLTFSHLDLDEGLQLETIHCIDKDDNRFIWLGSSNGFVCYNIHDEPISQIGETDTKLLTTNYCMISNPFHDKKGSITSIKLIKKTIHHLNFPIFIPIYLFSKEKFLL